MSVIIIIIPCEKNVFKVSIKLRISKKKENLNEKRRKNHKKGKKVLADYNTKVSQNT